MELLVAVDHNQLRTIGSETVDPIDWSHPHTHGQYLQSSTYCTVLIKHGLQIARLAAPTGTRARVQGYARPTHCLCGHSWSGLHLGLQEALWLSSVIYDIWFTSQLKWNRYKLYTFRIPEIYRSPSSAISRKSAISDDNAVENNWKIAGYRR